jgi:hypothetical protein
MNTLHHRLAFFFSLAFVAACGSSSKTNGGDVVASCKQACPKVATLCAADLGTDAATARAVCETLCTSTGPQAGRTCTNSAEIIAASEGCSNKATCAEYMTCSQSIPACMGSSGSGGSSGAGTGGRAGGGSGGTSGGGTGGAGGATAGTACADLLACCNRSTNPQVMAGCMAQYTNVMAMGDSACAQALAILLPACP